MGCFSFLCKKCGRPINSDSFRGQRVHLYLLEDGDLVEHMNGEYDSYGRVFDEEGESIKWSIPWTDVVNLMFHHDKRNGICAVHERCWGKRFVPETRSDDDPNQGWGRFKIPEIPFKKPIQIPKTEFLNKGEMEL
jgi:hypothetical protein